MISDIIGLIVLDILLGLIEKVITWPFGREKKKIILRKLEFKFIESESIAHSKDRNGNSVIWLQVFCMNNYFKTIKGCRANLYSVWICHGYGKCEKVKNIDLRIPLQITESNGHYKTNIMDHNLLKFNLCYIDIKRQELNVTSEKRKPSKRWEFRPGTYLFKIGCHAYNARSDFLYLEIHHKGFENPKVEIINRPDEKYGVI
ncbi:MAG: hypothetical protein GY865_13805 [candidate division Zixibacteria bacterium]|nr:hypothetical protein [candidate division Zixibacteria bacterium]